MWSWLTKKSRSLTPIPKVLTRHSIFGKRQNSGLNLNQDKIKNIDKYVNHKQFYNKHKYLQEIEEKEGIDVGYFYDSVHKYLTAYKNIFGRKERDNKPTNDKLYIKLKHSLYNLEELDRLYTDYALLQERPIISLFTHGSIYKNMNFKYGNTQFKTTPLEVDLIYICAPEIGFSQSGFSPFDREYKRIIEKFKYISLLNEVNEDKQIEIIAEELRKFCIKMHEKKIDNTRKTIEQYEKSIQENNKIIDKIKNDIFKLDSKRDYAIKLISRYNEMIKDQEKSTLEIKDLISKRKKAIQDFERKIKQFRETFRAYKIPKGVALNKLLTKNLSNENGPVNKDEAELGVYAIQSRRDIFGSYAFASENIDKVYFSGKKVIVSLDLFINDYYQKMKSKPEKMIIIDNSCSNIYEGGDNYNKEITSQKEINEYKKRFKNANASTRSFNRYLPKIEKSLRKQFNIPNSNKLSYTLKRSAPLNNNEITRIIENTRKVFKMRHPTQKHLKKKLTNEEVQKELQEQKNKMNQLEQATSRSRSRSRSRSKSKDLKANLDGHEETKEYSL